MSRTREQMVRELAEAIEVELAKNFPDFYVQLPNKEATVRYKGDIDLLALAEWFYCRLG